MPVSDHVFVPVRVSLSDVLGRDYIDAVVRARSLLTGEDPATLERMAMEQIDCFPAEFERRLVSLLPSVGRSLAPPATPFTAVGATSKAFAAASSRAGAPVSAVGPYRLAEDGRLRFITKSEHYHVPLGHGFPGFRLVDRARSLGIPNATHNNTRGHVTRVLEDALVRAAHGLAADDAAGTAAVLGSCEPDCVNRVLNLETGSLAAEAAFKMCMARFTESQPGAQPPPYAGRTPVFLVIADDDGKPTGNYHGTTAFVQALRGLWPGLSDRMEACGLMRVCAVRPNVPRDLEEAFERFEMPPFKIAAFFHEIVMMNYGARVLSRSFLRRAYDLCHQFDVPTVCDEIQSCLWAPGLLLFREYGLSPSFVVVGKGLSGGEYAASRVLFSATMDNLSQFGALVTNGQEELASLTYLIAMRWALANEEPIRALGTLYAERLNDLASRWPGLLGGVEGLLHMSALRFQEIAAARVFVDHMNARGYDLSLQAYKADCPPVVLTKLPLIAGAAMIEAVVEAMEAALAEAAMPGAV